MLQKRELALPLLRAGTYKLEFQNWWNNLTALSMKEPTVKLRIIMIYYHAYLRILLGKYKI